jgi:uncharacterized repeat protein (TIGR03803 family)
MIKHACFSIAACAVVCLFTTAHAVSARADDIKFSTLYKFEAPAATTFTSALGSQPDTLPVLGPDGAIYGMTSVGGQYGNGVIYRFDRDTHQYTGLHTFSSLNANGENADGATPGMALTRGPGDVIYGMASYGGRMAVARSSKSTRPVSSPCCTPSAPWTRTETIRTEPIHCGR